MLSQSIIRDVKANQINEKMKAALYASS